MKEETGLRDGDVRSVRTRTSCCLPARRRGGCARSCGHVCMHAPGCRCADVRLQAAPPQHCLLLQIASNIMDIRFPCPWTIPTSRRPFCTGLVRLHRASATCCIFAPVNPVARSPDEKREEGDAHVFPRRHGQRTLLSKLGRGEHCMRRTQCAHPLRHGPVHVSQVRRVADRFGMGGFAGWYKNGGEACWDGQATTNPLTGLCTV